MRWVLGIAAAVSLAGRAGAALPIRAVAPVYLALIGEIGPGHPVVQNLLGARTSEEQTRVLAWVEAQTRSLPPQLETLEHLDAHVEDLKTGRADSGRVEELAELSRRMRELEPLYFDEGMTWPEKLANQMAKARTLARRLIDLHRETRDFGFDDDERLFRAAVQARDLAERRQPYLDESDPDMIRQLADAHDYVKREARRALSRGRSAEHAAPTHLVERLAEGLRGEAPLSPRALDEREITVALERRRLFRLVGYDGSGDFRVGDLSHSVEHPSDPRLSLFGIAQSGWLRLGKPGQNPAGLRLGGGWRMVEATNERIVYRREERHGFSRYAGRIEAAFAPGPRGIFQRVTIILERDGERTHRIELEEVPPDVRHPELGP